ncbi:MAG: glutamate-5-semialdehyde dehydrogenase [bacterium]|nr:glutamate-5-semialdehyde dehydrogenase [bacterium]
MNLEETLEKVRDASHRLVMVKDKEIKNILGKLAYGLETNVTQILKANEMDLSKIAPADHIYDRILLNEERVKEIAQSVLDIADYDSPIGVEIEHKVLNNGLDLRKVTTPIGVVGAIFEARPNVIIDIFALCFKSKNACVLKGGSQCKNTNEVLQEIIERALGELSDVVALLPNDRSIVNDFLKADKFVDVIIPRGSQKLIDHVRMSSTIPVIETGRGVCHTYFDESGDLDKARDIIFNAKTQRPSVCNSLDTLIIHKSRLSDLPEIVRRMEEKRVEIFADKDSYEALKENYSKDLLYEAKGEDFGFEFLSLKMSVKTVSDLDEAIKHINHFGSHHSEAILTEDMINGEKFLKSVDAACVYVNASIRFTDGGVFGLGAEVGVSTQKLHARGPMGIKELTSYKWQIVGDGQVRQ